MTGHDAEKRELEALLKSDVFSRAPSLAIFLSYVSEKYFTGAGDQVKEYNIAVEALGRPADFNQKQDSVVRVEAHRLRKRLRDYYASEGAGHPVHITIPPGQYVPRFIHRPSQDSWLVPQDFPPDAPAAAPVPDLRPARQLPPVMPPPRRARHHWTVWGLAGILFLGLAIALLIARKPGLPAFRVPGAVAADPPVALGGEDEVRILAGSSLNRYVDHLGNIWSGDRYFTGGSLFATPNHLISRTPDPQIFQWRREGRQFSYDIPLDPGLYELHLYFSETVFGEGNVAGGGESSRIFRILANGNVLAGDLDIISDAGGSNIADERVFRDLSPAHDGLLHLRFEVVKEAAILNGLALLPQVNGRVRPVRLLARDARYTDSRGALWLPDRYVDGGQTVLRTERVAGTADPELYRGERYGHFRYTIPVAPGRYAVRLNFAETWFGPGRAAQGGAGSRVFHVFLNGVAILRQFDIFREAGGANRALEKIFHDVSPNAQGKIVLSFVPERNYACINSIEITEEAR